MKTNKLFAAALAATTLLAASCAKENEGGTKPADVEVEGQKTYAVVDVALPASVGVTRAYDQFAGFAAEKKVAEIGIFIVDNASARVDYEVFDVDTDFEALPVGNQPGDRQIFTGKVAVQTVTGVKTVYAVANPSANLLNKLATSGATATNDVAFKMPKTDFLNGALTSMAMSGVHNGDLDMTEPQTAAEAIADPIAITIERNLAKVVLQQGSKYEVIGGTTTLVWATVAEARDSYFMRQTEGSVYKTLYGTVPAAALTSASHPYWTNFTDHRLPAAGEYISLPAYDAQRKSSATYAMSKYMFENMPEDDDSFLVGNTTAARLKGVFDPTTIYNGTGVTAYSPGTPMPANGFTAGEDFYRSKLDGTYWTLAGMNAVIAAGYNGHDNTNDFLFYEGGVGYYTIYVHADEANEYKKGVTRNTFYLLGVNEVRGPGTPENELPDDPFVPVPEDTNMSSEITVENWDFQSSEQHIQ